MASTDYRRKIVDYFKQNLSKGYTEESLKWALINQGYSRTDVSRAIEQVHKELAEKAPMIKEKPKIKYEIYDVDNKLIKVETRRPFSIKNFFNDLFS
jgi:hypothetical protein|tara:strand:- start:10552 stop:10842 length:291 start_codon:yes stop_codon:yes gene_type:complete